MTMFLTLLTSIIFMELASWLIHKYLMHGPMWNIHKTHHEHTKGKIELNDFFSVFFAGLAMALLIPGLANQNPYLVGAGAGISVFGVLYFVIHDVFIHKRIRFFGRSNNPLLNALADAHRDHHKSRERDGSTSFGLLLVDLKYYKKYYRKKKKL